MSKAVTRTDEVEGEMAVKREIREQPYEFVKQERYASAVFTQVTAKRVLSVPVLPTIVPELLPSAIRSFTCVFSARGHGFH